MSIVNIDDYLNVTAIDWKTSETFRLLKNAPGTKYQECDEKDKRNYREWVKGLLQATEVTVTFVKSDGTLRDMRCTLDYNKLPVKHVPNISEAEEKAKKPKDPEVQPVFDLDLKQWRSFRYDRLRKISANISLE